MATKTTFAKLGLKKKNEQEIIKINDFDVKVTQYLPVEEKIEIITNVLQNSADENNFANPIKVEVFYNLEIMYHYTDISFTEKQKEDPTKLYDLLEENGIFEQVINVIPDEEYNHLYDWLMDTLKGYYGYRSSALGIMEQISTDYSNLDFDATQIQNKIADPENLTLLKGVMDKLG